MLIIQYFIAGSSPENMAKAIAFNGNEGFLWN